MLWEIHKTIVTAILFKLEDIHFRFVNDSIMEAEKKKTTTKTDASPPLPSSPS